MTDIILQLLCCCANIPWVWELYTLGIDTQGIDTEGIPGMWHRHPPLGPLEGLPAQTPARLGSMDSSGSVMKRMMCIGIVNKDKTYLVTALLTSVVRTANWMVVQSRARALGAAGDGRNARSDTLLDSLGPHK
jgi:hypothetical protein